MHSLLVLLTPVQASPAITTPAMQKKNQEEATENYSPSQSSETVPFDNKLNTHIYPIQGKKMYHRRFLTYHPVNTNNR